MFWFFEREGAKLHYEIRRDAEGPTFELVVTFPDGTQRVERIEEPNELAERSGSLRSALRDQGWRSIGGD